MKKHIVISLGGSIIVPEEIDISFVKDFISTIKEYVSKDFHFIIITGGGRTCRKYNNALKEIVSPTDIDLDWLGIQVTHLNAEFIRICFGDLTHEKISLDPDNIPETDKPIIVGGGFKPGNSSDLVAVRSAINIGAKKVINLSNIDYIYDKDPNKFSDAQIIKETTWKEFRNILPKEWGPGINVPFDPIAAKEAEENGLEVVVMNGRKIINLKDYLDNKDFIGTIIK